MSNNDVPGFSDFTSLITSVEISAWGSELLLNCLYDPVDPKPYRILFHNCSQIALTVHHPEHLNDLEADVIGISLGVDQHLEPAVIHTDIFEIAVVYGSCEIFKT